MAEDPAAVLREEIQRASGSVVRTRHGLRLLFWTPATVLVALALIGFLVQWIPPGWPLGWIQPSWLYGGFSGAALWAILVGLPVLMLAAPVLFMVLTIRRVFLRGRLAAYSRALPAEDIRSTLLPLTEAADTETRRLAASLLRDLNLPTELTPAGTLEGSGAEVSANGE